MTKYDLKIGNHAIYGGHVVEMTINEMIHFDRFPERYSALPLTDERLMALNFTNEGGQWSAPGFRGALTRCKPEKDSDKTCYRWTVNSLRITDIYYAHELENLLTILKIGK